MGILAYILIGVAVLLLIVLAYMSLAKMSSQKEKDQGEKKQQQVSRKEEGDEACQLPSTSSSSRYTYGGMYPGLDSGISEEEVSYSYVDKEGDLVVVLKDGTFSNLR